MTAAPGLEATIGEGRDWLEARMYDEGAECPCCTQNVKVYRRKITASMARVLIDMHRDHGTGWVHLPSIRSAGQDEVLTRHWGLIERDAEVRPDGSTRTGWWRLTPLGVAWVTGRETVAKYAVIYDNRCLELEGDAVTITDSLGDRFDYGDLMAGR
ncbi:hypothetical protein PBI_INDLOVU_49 [Mycobacterium phage Indlovu]|nr:hypothetical protein PBI_INDLOVU_49 [Mycobacterium phage Indlovu]